MICYQCDKEDWFRLPHVNKDRCLQVCKVCGNAVMEVQPGEEQKMRDYYRKEYRPEPTHTNLITTTNKTNYVVTFLKELLDDAKKNKKSLICGDVGAATGYIPNKLRQLGHKATGSEYTVTFRRFSEHYYGVPLTEELEPKHKYDLISIYHVLEHMIEPDKKLQKYAGMLAEGGHMLISTPEWLNYLEEGSGQNLVSVRQHYHKDHINVFTSKSIQGIFAKAGLKVIKENHLTYGQTYLLKKMTDEERKAVDLKKFYTPL